jgi:DNA-binding transcriptional LysR family regulator
MNLRHIEIFHAVYVNGSVSAAARALNVSQPSVSKMLRHAESLLGFQLFQRTNGGLVPTEDAHALFDEVREIQDRVQLLREAGRNLRRGSGGMLRVSTLPSLALDAVPSAVSRFLRTHGDVKFDLQTVHHDDLMRKLHERETDIAVAYRVPPAAPIAQQWLGEGELVVIYREQDMPDAPPAVELKRLAGSASSASPRADRQASSFRRDRAARARAGRSRLRPHLLHRCRSRPARRRHGGGRQLHCRSVPRARLSMRRLKPRLTFDIHAMYLVNRPLGALATEFLKTLKRVLDAP